MPIAPEGRFIPVNMDQCQDLMGGLFEHVTPVLSFPFPLFCMIIQPKHGDLV